MVDIIILEKDVSYSTMLSKYLVKNYNKKISDKSYKDQMSQAKIEGINVVVIKSIEEYIKKIEETKDEIQLGKNENKVEKIVVISEAYEKKVEKETKKFDDILESCKFYLVILRENDKKINEASQAIEDIKTLNKVYINKYSSQEKLLKIVLKTCGEKKQTTATKTNKNISLSVKEEKNSNNAANSLLDAEIITIYTLDTNISKSKIALNIANFYSMSYKTLLLSFEMFSSISLKEEENSINIINAITSSCSLTKNIFEKFTYIKNPNLYMLYPNTNPLEMLNITYDDFRRFTKKIKEFGFKKVILLLDERLDSITVEIMKSAELNILLHALSEDKVKYKYFKEMIEKNINLKNIKKNSIEIRIENKERKDNERIIKALKNIC